MQLEEERHLVDHRRARREYGRLLRKQYQAQMKRKSHIIQEELEADILILDALNKQDTVLQEQKSQKRAKEMTDTIQMRDIMREQMELERRREAEMELLYCEEADRQWEKRQDVWRREQNARDNLMADVLRGRGDQLLKQIEVSQTF